MTPQSLMAQTAYAELLERLLSFEYSRNIANLKGSFAEKMVKGRPYVYYQYRDASSDVKQIYLGPKTPELEQMIANAADLRAQDAGNQEELSKLARAFVAAGGIPLLSSHGKIIRELADSGVFRVGGILIGTQAFTAIGNLLGVQFEHGAQKTMDIDIAKGNIHIAFPEVQADLPAALRRLEMGFLPVPPFDHNAPSTSYSIKRGEIRVDIVTAQTNEKTAPVKINSMNAYAQPLRFLDYILENPAKCAIPTEPPILANVPDPARFAFHKLLVSQERHVTQQTKVVKDVQQAEQILDALLELRIHDIKPAYDEMIDRGKGWSSRLVAGIALMAKSFPETAEKLAELIDLPEPQPEKRHRPRN